MTYWNPVEKYGVNAYKLNLLEKYSKLHYTFYISLLQAYRARPEVKPRDARVAGRGRRAPLRPGLMSAAVPDGSPDPPGTKLRSLY